MSSIAEMPAESAYASDDRPEPTRLSDFQRRMKGLVQRNGVSQKRAVEKPANLKTVTTLEEYKHALDDNGDKIVVVRFFATWCKACKAIQPSFYRMASLYPHITFLEVPVTNENVNLHQGLEIPSLPYGHIYYPNAGLVEELKISKQYFPNLVKMVRWYDVGACGLDEYVPEADDTEK
jgi:thiol-disulfide isomerase/thioredoxin